MYRLSGIVCLLLFFSCSPQDKKFRQYYTQGQMLYEKHCSNCHQQDGQGLRRLYPPLAKSDFLKNNFNPFICTMKYGTSGSIVVNGVEFNKLMPGVPSLTELELAELATYITNSWGEQGGIVTIEQVSQALSGCAPQ